MAGSGQWQRQPVIHLPTQALDSIGLPSRTRHLYGMLLGITEFGHQASKRRENAGELRYHNMGNAKFTSKCNSVHGAGATESDQCAGSCIDATFDGNPP